VVKLREEYEGTSDGRPESAEVEVNLDMAMAARPADDGRSVQVIAVIGRAAVDIDSVPAHKAGIEAFAALANRKFVMIVSPRGQLLGTGLLDGPVSDAEAAPVHDLADRLAAALLVPFPVEAVGVGARWRVRRVSSLSNIAMLEEVAYELKHREGDAIQIEAHVGRVPLFDADGVIPNDAANVARARRALDARSGKSFDQLDRDVEPSQRGRQSVAFAGLDPLRGAYQRAITFEFEGTLPGDDGDHAIAAKTTEIVSIVSIDGEDGKAVSQSQ